MGSFRSNVWDPVHILAQIICMQCIFYCSSGLCLWIVDYIVGQHPGLDQIFGYEDLHFKDVSGRLVAIAFIINSLTGAFGLWFVVRRTKLCLDYTATVHILHLALCLCYCGHLPRTLSWWLVNVVCIVIMTVLGEFLCMRSELKAIPITVGPKADL